MKEKDQQKRELRIRAENILREKDLPRYEMSESKMKELIYELQVHQIELEIQNDELRKTQNKTEQDKHIAIGEVAGKIAHDFNNILSIIMGNAEIGIAKYPDKEIKKIFEIIYQQTVRGRNLTRELAIFSKDATTMNDKHTKIEKTHIEQINYVNNNVLIVEDEEQISSMLRKVLTNEPFKHNVDIAINGETAIELFIKNRYDFISLDYILSGSINGMDVYKYIRQKDTDIPILFISGNIEFLESIESLKQKDNNIDHLPKPHKINEYINLVNQLIGLSLEKKEV